MLFKPGNLLCTLSLLAAIANAAPLSGDEPAPPAQNDPTTTTATADPSVTDTTTATDTPTPTATDTATDSAASDAADTTTETGSDTTTSSSADSATPTDSKDSSDATDATPAKDSSSTSTPASDDQDNYVELYADAFTAVWADADDKGKGGWASLGNDFLHLKLHADQKFTLYTFALTDTDSRSWKWFSAAVFTSTNTYLGLGSAAKDEQKDAAQKELSSKADKTFDCVITIDSGASALPRGGVAVNGLSPHIQYTKDAVGISGAKCEEQKKE